MKLKKYTEDGVEEDGGDSEDDVRRCMKQKSEDEEEMVVDNVQEVKREIKLYLRFIL